MNQDMRRHKLFFFGHLVRPDGTKNALANETEIFLSHGFSCPLAGVSGAVIYLSVIGALVFPGACGCRYIRFGSYWFMMRSCSLIGSYKFYNTFYNLVKENISYSYNLEPVVCFVRL